MRNFAIVALLLLFSMPICLNAQRNSPQRFQLAVGITDADYVPGRVIFKVREEYRAYCTGQQIALPLFQRWLEAMRAGTVRQTFPHADRPAEPRNALGERLVDLSLIYQVDYTNQVDIEEAVNLLLRTGLVEYAEPSYIYQSLYNPNDPDTTGQYYLALIKARQAWDISKGDSTVKIGIIDTGGSFFHPDWAPKIAKNWADPIDGFDNDNNGYIDDFQGWDFGGDIWDSPGDNNPQWGGVTAGSDHGVLTGGAAAAFTDNGLDVAAIGFNSTLIPIKVSINESPQIYYGFQGVVYGADIGADILNMSWGGGDSECRMCSDAIRYAAINKGVLLVAAAGNTPSQLNFYPASFPEVISVPGTQQNNAWWSSSSNFGSSFSYFADVCAPSRDILTTTADFGLYSATGTSLGSPIVSGIAALVHEHHPSLNMRQVGQMVRMGADEGVYSLNGNSRQELMGRGSADALGALTYTGPAVRAVEVMYDTQDGLVQAGDTVEVRIRFANFLDPVTNLQIDLTTPNFGQFQILHGTVSAGTVGTLDTVSTWVCPFKVRVLPTASTGFFGYLRIGYTGDNYSDYEYYGLRVQPSYVNLDANRLETSFDGKGRWGFTNFPNLSNGQGLVVDGVGSLMNDAGFLVGISGTKVSDNIENQTGAANQHFINATPIVRTPDATKADLEATTAFTDAGAGGNALGVTVSQHSYQWSMETDDSYFIQEYTIHNTSGTALNNVYAGLYYDLDGFWRTQNRSHYDAVSRTIYNMDTTWVSLWDIGVSLLTPDSLRGYAVNTGTFSYTTANKFTAISSPPSGAELGPANVAQFTGAGPFNIAAGDSHVVAFAVVMGDSLQAMRAARQAAYDKYWCVVRRGMAQQPDLGADIFNCGSVNPVTLDAGAGYATYQWSTGATTQTISATTGDYWVSVSDGLGCTDYDRISVTLDPGLNSSFNNLPAQFHVGDTVLFSSTTAGATEWCWSWGDGSNDCPIQSAATHVFTVPGTYSVCLTTGNGVCANTSCIQYVVDTLVGIDPRMASSLLTVAPIPATERILASITNDYVGQVYMSLIDIAGRGLVQMTLDKSAPSLSQMIDISGLPNGLYLLEVKGAFGRETRKVLKQ